ncbi:MAG: hypothetical protein RL329_4201, partial [Bacteroidota bacterium]
QIIAFWYKKSSSPITALNPNASAANGWTAVTALDLSNPIYTNVAAVYDANDPAYRVSATNVSIPSLSLANNEYIMLKWDDPDHSSADQSMGLDDVTIAWGSVLPIELTAFDAQNTEGSKNNLTWATASELNNKHFDIERSTDGTTFHSIGQVKGNNKPSSYQFVDNQPFATTYYRLRQIDFDGTETLSKVVSVELKGKGKGLAVYPNPVSSLLNVVYTEGASFQILNLLGQQVLTGKTAAQVDVSALPQGTYILKVGAEQAKFLKQ